MAAGWVIDEASLASWLDAQLTHALASVDLPILARLHEAARTDDAAGQSYWSRYLIALRETRELVGDDCDRGHALARLLRDLGVTSAAPWVERADAPYAALTAIAAVAWEIPLVVTAQAYAWSWLENQVLAGVKLIPLGQVSGQRLLLELASRIPVVCDQALGLADDEIGGMLPMVALASSLHETQYTRLFRS